MFLADGDWKDISRLDMSGKEWGTYALAYKKAGDYLAEQFLEDSPGVDFLALPTAYLYRHYIELSLKELIAHGQSVLGENVDFPETHSLGELWTRAQGIIERVSGQGHWQNGEELGAVRCLIAELDSFDPDGEQLRYAFSTKKKGRKPSLRKLNRINIRKFYEVMQRLSRYLDGCIDGLSEIGKPA